jgi:hypothetical protein
MSRWRRSSFLPTSEYLTSQYNAYLAGWAIAFAVLLVALMLIAHGADF